MTKEQLINDLKFGPRENLEELTYQILTGSFARKESFWGWLLCWIFFSEKYMRERTVPENTDEVISRLILALQNDVLPVKLIDPLLGALYKAGWRAY
jgi:hypothetical protein